MSERNLKSGIGNGLRVAALLAGILVLPSIVWTIPTVTGEGIGPRIFKEVRMKPDGWNGADKTLDEAAALHGDLLSQGIADFSRTDFDEDMLGFSKHDLAKLLDVDVNDGLTDPDQVPEPLDEAITQPDDLWILGDHRLLCGDSGNAEHVDRLLNGATVQLVNTDPPYNVNVEPRSNNAITAGLSSFGYLQPADHHHQALDLTRHPEKSQPTTRKLRAKDRPLENDFVSDKEFDRLLHAWFGNIARVLEPGRSFYIWGGYDNCESYPPALKDVGLYRSQAIIWDKQWPVLTRKDFMGAHEWCFYGWKEGAAHEFFGPNNVPDLWHVKKINPNKMIHLTEQPVELAVRAMKYSSRRGENVLDLFGGSGSTLIAAEQTGRRAFLMELDPPYCDVIVRRWEQFTGERATRRTVANGIAHGAHARRPAGGSALSR